MVVDPGFTPAQNVALKRLLAKPLTHADIAILGMLWSRVANPAEANLLTSRDVAERYFNNQRKRFWRTVRGSGSARSLFEACGFTFSPKWESAPRFKMPEGHQTLQGKDEIRLDIDHIAEKQTRPDRALDPSNLEIIFSRENQQSLRLINQHYRKLQLPGTP